jgi:hypothetical protein
MTHAAGSRPRDWHAWTRDRFRTWLTSTGVPVCVEAPYELAPCTCGDVNCHGWRLVPVDQQPRGDS